MEKMKKYRVCEENANGTTGQDCGSFFRWDLPAHIQARIDAAPFGTYGVVDWTASSLLVVALGSCRP